MLKILHSSILFIQSLSTLMSSTYHKFQEVVGDGDGGKAVWGSVTFVVEQIFKKDFGQVRAKMIDSIDANNKTSGMKLFGALFVQWELHRN